MLDIKFLRENPDKVKENIKKKFQDQKLAMVDEVIALDEENRAAKSEVETLRAKRNKASKLIGSLMAQGKKEEAAAAKEEIAKEGDRIDELTAKVNELEEKISKELLYDSSLEDEELSYSYEDGETVRAALTMNFIEKIGTQIPIDKDRGVNNIDNKAD